MTRPKKEFDTVLRLVAEARNDSDISRRTGIPRTTVRDWRLGLRTSSPRNGGSCPGDHSFSALPARQYSYLLGLYLGDGFIASSRRGVWKLRISMDARYTGIIEQACAAMEAVMPGQRAHRLHRTGCVEVSMYSKHWVCLLPQHGPGPKHLRRISLTA